MRNTEQTEGVWPAWAWMGKEQVGWLRAWREKKGQTMAGEDVKVSRE